MVYMIILLLILSQVSAKDSSVRCVVEFEAMVVIFHASVIVRGFIGLFFQASCVLWDLWKLPKIA